MSCIEFRGWLFFIILAVVVVFLAFFVLIKIYESKIKILEHKIAKLKSKEFNRFVQYHQLYLEATRGKHENYKQLIADFEDCTGFFPQEQLFELIEGNNLFKDKMVTHTQHDKVLRIFEKAINKYKNS